MTMRIERLVLRARRLNDFLAKVKEGGSWCYESVTLTGPPVLPARFEIESGRGSYITSRYVVGYIIRFEVSGSNAEAVFRAMIQLAEAHAIDKRIIAELFGEE